MTQILPDYKNVRPLGEVRRLRKYRRLVGIVFIVVGIILYALALDDNGPIIPIWHVYSYALFGTAFLAIGMYLNNMIHSKSKEVWQ